MNQERITEKKNRSSTNASHRLQHWQIVNLILVVYDALAVYLAFACGLWLRFDCSFSEMIEQPYWDWFLHFAPIYVVLCIFVFQSCKLYTSIWRFASYSELLHCILATSITFVIQCVGITVFYGRMPISYYLFGTVLQFILIISIRFAYRFVNLLRSRNSHKEAQNNVLIIGAGQAGQALIRDILNGDKVQEDKICAIIDDNHNKWGRYIENIKVVGGRNEILSTVDKFHINRIYFAIPTATVEQRRDILQICNATNCEVKQLPGAYQFITGEITTNALKNVPIEDLLGREPIKADMSTVYDSIHGKTILVTGGGGSIGSELCRQVAAHNPKQLIIFDVYENNAYSIQLELKEKYPELDLITLIGSVRDSRRVNDVFEKYHPDIVYHAAAHKHVPLMEDSPCESIKNNVIGTYKCCYAAMRSGCSRFVLISTDKAVNPTNIMGASKRLCEMVVQTFDKVIRDGNADLLPEIYTHASPVPPSDQLRIKEGAAYKPVTSFVAVRFGNVLGSNGSVIPIFKKQIEKGGPVTVTHPDIIRYFMTIPEAVSLVLMAGTYAQGGNICVLDMGSPVKIDTLARNLIRQSGLRPDVDIKIEYTGLRPGEKLYEEKLMDEEGLQMTEHKLVHIGKPIPIDIPAFLEQLKTLEQYAYDNNEEEIRNCVCQVVSTYHPELGAKG